MTKGVLLLNLGTPSAPDVRSVRKYLAEFLADKYVISLPTPLRLLLLYGYILPFRAKTTAEAYQSVWTEHGSPFLFHHQRLQKKLQASLGNNYTVALGMRYGKPSIEDALNQLRPCSHLIVLPLYPQYASATTTSSLAFVFEALKRLPSIPSLSVISSFYKHPKYIEAQSRLIQPYLENHEFILFSYHGLPLQHLKNSGCQLLCKNDCPLTTPNDTSCYRAQCYQTTASVAQRLQLKPHQYTTAFQSRLGKATWIKPYTEEMLHALRQKNIKRLAIAAPSFVVDCLETLEEIALRAKKQWLALGGEELTLIPCLNDDDAWISSLKEMIKEPF